jgi:hypothetical protein
VCSPLKIKMPSALSCRGLSFFEKEKFLRLNATFAFSENLCQKSSLLLWAKRLWNWKLSKTRFMKSVGSV